MDFKQSIKKMLFVKKALKKSMAGAGVFFAELSIAPPPARDQMAFISGCFIRVLFCERYFFLDINAEYTILAKKRRTSCGWVAAFCSCHVTTILTQGAPASLLIK